jgi:hypothetical protein
MKKFVSAMIGLSIVATSAMADKVSMSKDGLGDFLIAPLYKAQGDICTKVNVYNTNTTESVLAKVVFREKKASNEVDFPIFLSPGDVWSGMVCQGANGDVFLTSNDDSNHPQIQATLRTGKDLTAHSRAAGNVDVDFTTGYIEVYPIAEFNEGSDAKVEKKVLVERWNKLIKGQTPSKLVTRGVDGYSLTGNVEYVTSNKATSVLPMVAFKGAHDKTLRGSSIAYGNDTSPDVLLGTNKKFQLLKTLQHNTAVFNYSNGGKNQYIAFTYPFGYANNQVRKFKISIRDMSENKDVTKEVIFSPVPKVSSYTMSDEVAIISVADLIAKTNNPAMFQEGQIQITDITNLTDVQLGMGKAPSFIATYFTMDKNAGGKDLILNSSYTPVK